MQSVCVLYIFRTGIWKKRRWIVKYFKKEFLNNRNPLENPVIKQFVLNGKYKRDGFKVFFFFLRTIIRSETKIVVIFPNFFGGTGLRHYKTIQ